MQDSDAIYRTTAVFKILETQKPSSVQIRSLSLTFSETLWIYRTPQTSCSTEPGGCERLSSWCWWCSLLEGTAVQLHAAVYSMFALFQYKLLYTLDRQRCYILLSLLLLLLYENCPASHLFSCGAPCLHHQWRCRSETHKDTPLNWSIVLYWDTMKCSIVCL